uniref:HRAS-like suppressor n=1 Tax=Caligus rogercresseyi TaxID=217165 RepID=C1BQJ9_CALRO|nr:HRAS-like suppressor [Caligus rogercresseyi]
MSNVELQSRYYNRDELRLFLAIVEYGDLVEFNRELYNHWGVYVGHGQVTHLSNSAENMVNISATFRSTNSMASGGEASKGHIMTEKLVDVIGDSLYRINNSYDRDCPPDDVATMKRNISLEKGKNLTYDLCAYNCEHFSKKVRNRHSVSHQVNDTITAVAVAGGAVLVGGLLLGQFNVAKRQNK